MKINAIIPTINRADLLQECLVPLKAHADKLFDILVIDNGRQEGVHSDKDVAVILPASNLGVAGSWNKGLEISRIQGVDWAIILNDDIVLKDETVAGLQDILGRYQDKWLVVGECSYSVFAINLQCLSAMEYSKDKFFDEGFFPAYCEDVDFEWRMKLIDPTKIVRPIPDLTPAVYRRKGSSEKDPTLRDYSKVRRRFVEKWGGGPKNPKYKIPFNGLKKWPEE